MGRRSQTARKASTQQFFHILFPSFALWDEKAKPPWVIKIGILCVVVTSLSKHYKRTPNYYNYAWHQNDYIRTAKITDRTLLFQQSIRQ